MLCNIKLNPGTLLVLDEHHERLPSSHIETSYVSNSTIMPIVLPACFRTRLVIAGRPCTKFRD